VYPRRFFWVLLGVALCAPVIARTQSAINPDLSVIGDMRYAYRDDVAAALAGQDNLAFQFEELEINIAGYLNPYARADVFVAIHGVSGPVQLEEAYATLLRGLPVKLRFGKYFLDFGRINQKHRHQLAWLEYPLVLRSFFGPEGARVVGLRASRLQGIGDTAVELSVNAFSSDFFSRGDEGAVDEESDAHEHGDKGETKIAGSGRLSLFREIGSTAGVELAGSYLHATYDLEDNLKTQVAGVEVAFKWVPDTYKGVKVIAELMMDDREVPVDTLGNTMDVTAYGAFADAELRFRKRYDIGAFYDWSQDPFDSSREAKSYGGYFGFMPVEDTARFSIVYRRTESDEFQGAANSVIFQVLWSLGPHKPHPF